MKKLILFCLIVVLVLSGCAFNKVLAARVCGDTVGVSVPGTPVKVTGTGVNAIVVYQSFWTLEKGRQVPPLCDITASEVGAYTTVSGGYTTKDNFFVLTNPDIATKTQRVEGR